MRSIILAGFMAFFVSGCALRQRYADFISSKSPGKEATFVVTDAATQQPVVNAKIEVSELREKITTTTGPDGTFKLPIDKKYVEENPVFVVTLPRGFEKYRIALVPVPVPVVPVEEDAPP